MTVELFFSCLVAAGMGYFLARRGCLGRLTELSDALAQKDKLLKSRVSQLKVYRSAQLAQRTAWNQVAQELPMAVPRRRLLLKLTEFLADMPVPESAKTSLHSSTQSMMTEQGVQLHALVQQVNEARVARLWEEGTYESLHAIVHELVKSPAAANASDFGALQGVSDAELHELGIRDTCTSDFDGLQVIESYEPEARHA